MKNNIKKAPVKFWEDLLYFQHFMQILFLLQISDYHHLKSQNNGNTPCKPCAALIYGYCTNNNVGKFQSRGSEVGNPHSYC